MKLSPGICTCGNHIPSRRAITSLITEYKIEDINRMYDSEFGKRHTANLTFIYENLTKAIKNNNDSILLTNANHNSKDAINELAIWLAHKWTPGDVIKVKFLNRQSYLELLVKNAASEWMKHANIIFEFVENGDADIRIEFANDNIYKSQVGKLCYQITDQNKPTMHLGAYNIGLSEDVISGVFLHEFGHVLGCIHEHQHPVASIPWDEQKVIEHFAENQGWDEATTRHNVLNKLPSEDLSNSEYDIDSIMHYFFPAELTSNGVNFRFNTQLSKQDIEFISFCYPF